MSQPLTENEAIESEIVEQACAIVGWMKERDSHLPRKHFEKYLRPLLRKALLEARIEEAERCEAYGRIGSPRVAELKAARNRAEADVEELGKRR